MKVQHPKKYVLILRRRMTHGVVGRFRALDKLCDNHSKGGTIDGMTLMV